MTALAQKREVPLVHSFGSGHGKTGSRGWLWQEVAHRTEPRGMSAVGSARRTGFAVGRHRKHAVMINADNQLTELVHLNQLTEATAAQVMKFLSLVSNDATPPTHIAPEDGVAVLFWVAGQKALTVDVTEAGADMAVVSDPVNGARTVQRPQAILQVTESALADLSLRVLQSARPNA